MFYTIIRISAPRALPSLRQRFIARPLLFRHFSTSKGAADHVHFRASGIPHPFNAKPQSLKEQKEMDPEQYDRDLADHTGRQQNHIWTKEEVDHVRANIHKHKPVTMMDKVMNQIMYGLYHSFNWLTGYKTENTSVSSIEWRLIVLESFAGVPGFVAAGFRHFRSLRSLQRDHGWILTLLEEAENERMHLLVCLQMFKASWVTRMLVVAAQVTMTPVLMLLYTVHPKSMHRFVGYLEETAVHTYDNIITQTETPGTPLHAAWADLPAPNTAIAYWRLPKDALWVDTLKCMMADESHHRDVNHTFATLPTDDPNPFVLKHKQDAARAWRLENSGRDCWQSKEKAL
mmetsp:Transcript_19110/g.37730  ORF Transcript_19110/g.37730 Transcript_19110/m.37730 type:complete len:344 (-) Transcript_19110:265-1296(-)